MQNNPLKINTVRLRNAIIKAMMEQFSWSKTKATLLTIELEKRYFSMLISNLVVVVEYPYVDKVFRNSYYRYYAGKAEYTSRDGIRLSFLIDTKPSLANKNMNPDVWTTQYQGFMILRPTELNIVGRNGISPNIYNNRDFVICKTNLPASVNGLKVEVEAFPASSQDEETMVCAETAVWSLMEYYGNKYAEYSPVRPSHIIKLLKNKMFERQLPSTGLTNDQICYLLKNLNFQPILQPITDDDDGYSLIGTFVESGIPIVLTINNTEDYDAGKVNNLIAHALLCIGRENVSAEAIDQVVAEKNDGYPSIVDYDKIKKRFVFVDDNFPAYAMDYLDRPTGRYDVDKMPLKEDWLACKIKYAIVPLYEKILLLPGLVKGLAKEFLFYLHIDEGKEITMRTFLASSRSYRDYICRSGMPQEMKEMIIDLYLPKFIWVVELSSRQGLKENYADGLMIFDSTEPKFKKFSSLKFMYYNKIAAYKTHKGELQIASNAPEVKFESYRRNLR